MPPVAGASNPTNHVARTAASVRAGRWLARKGSRTMPQAIPGHNGRLLTSLRLMPQPPQDRPPASEAAADTGMRKGLTSYGDAGFSLFLRKAFIKGAGYTDAALDRPVIGITDT